MLRSNRLRVKAGMGLNSDALAILLVLGVAGCSGGGGGSGDAGGSPGGIAYVGNTNPAVITTTNASTLIGNLVGTDETSGAIVASAITINSGLGGERERSSESDLAHRLNTYFRATLTQARKQTSASRLASAATPVDETTLCADGGSIHFSGSINDDGTGTLAASYNNCRTGDETVSGEVSLRVNAFDVALLIPTDSTFSFPNLTLASSGKNRSLSGSLRDQQSFATNTETLTANMVTRDNISGEMAKAENLSFVDVYDNLLFPSSYAETISGRTFDSVLGFVDITTASQLVFGSLSQVFPNSGQFLLTGAANARIGATTLSDLLLKVDMDLDGNGTYEKAATMKWADIGGAIAADLGDNDGDGMHNSWETFYGMNPSDPGDAGLDIDGDGFTAVQEYQHGTDPKTASSFPPTADLSITNTDSLDPVAAGNNLNYVLTVTNSGPSAADNVVVQDSLPVGVAFVGVSGSGWSCAQVGGTVTCSRSSLAVGVAPAISLTVTTPLSIGIVSNTAVVSADTIDLQSTNNSATQTTDVQVADLSITEADSVDPASAGTSFSYVLTVMNAGPLAAANVRVQDILPAGVGFVGAQGDGWNCAHVSGTVTCTCATLLVGAAPAITLTVTAPSSLGTVSNSVTVSSDTADFQQGNNSATENTGLAPAVLRFLEVHKEGVGGIQGLVGADAVTVSPDGAHVYVGSSREDSLAVFSRTPSTGALSLVEIKENYVSASRGLNPVSAIALSPDGAHLYAIPGEYNALVVFSRNSTTGALSFIEAHEDNVAGVDGLNFARRLVVSSDGAHVYVVGYFDNALAVFSRNPTTGMLSFVEVQKDDVGGVDGLSNPQDVAVSPDGAHVYVAGQTAPFLNNGSIAVFSRSASTGRLSFVEVQKKGVNGVDGIDRPSALTISPDGAHVYVVSPFDEAVATFRRDPTTGRLTFIAVQKQGISVTPGFDVAESVKVSPDGSHVYVAMVASDGSAVVVFRRDPATGALSYVETQKDGVAGVELAGQTLAVSPDGTNVYVAGGDFDQAKVAVFAVAP